jgi:hypothetical protein
MINPHADLSGATHPSADHPNSNAEADTPDADRSLRDPFGRPQFRFASRSSSP